MKSNKFKSSIIYLLIITLLIGGFITILQLVDGMQQPESQTDKIERDFNNMKTVSVETYSSVLNDFDNFIVEEYYLDLGSGYLHYYKKGEPNTQYYCNVPNVSLFVTDIEDYRKEYNSRNPDALLRVNYKKISDNHYKRGRRRISKTRCISREFGPPVPAFP